MVKAVIDIGTNSIKAVIASVEGDRIDIWADLSRVSRLGEELADTGNIGLEAMRRNLDILKDIRAICAGLQVESVLCVGAETLRRANDAGIFRQMLRQELGWDLHTLSSENEARLVFRASEAMAPPGLPVLVIDSGGGSTEFTFGQGGSISDWRSLPLGALTLTRRFVRYDPIHPQDFSALAEHVRIQLEAAFPTQSAPLTIACGGIFVALAAVSLELESFDADKVQGFLLTKEELARQTELFRKLDNEGRKKLTGMPPQRAEIILAGTLIARGIVQHFSLDAMHVSTRGLRHALLREELQI